MSERTGLEVAIVGMAARFPEASDIDEYWRRLCAGAECIRDLTDEELLAAGVPKELIEDPSYVKRVGVMEGEDLFDAAFFDFNPREAETIDPQQRVFMECAWHALENAGYTPHGRAIGVYAGSGANYYATNNLMTRPDYLRLVDPFQVKIGMDPDFLATRVAYKLNLLGPALTIQTACSTSLVTVHMACQGLLSGACDMALAGGVGIRVPQRIGSQHKEGGIVSPDGHCRAFDADARGTIGGNGVGVVVLKRLDEALADGDHVYAVIRGSAINNDGSRKVGFTAPSVEGQARVIRAAQVMAEVDPRTIEYIEAHGTGTSLGDPIEIAALTKAFREGTRDRGFCRIGSVKTVIGHLDTAAGIAGLVKAALALEREAIPATVNFETPNPAIDFENSPFRVVGELEEWQRRPDRPRRAGVSSFGIGGTNVHVVLEEAPEPPPADPGRKRQLLLLSARTPTALEGAERAVRRHLEDHPEAELADVAYTLHRGRAPFQHRLALVAVDAAEAVRRLGGTDAGGPWRGHAAGDREPVLLLPGQGAQYPGMARGLYDSEPGFRERVDQCVRLLEPHLGLDLASVLFPPAGGEEEAAAALRRTALTQPALFTIEYALAGLWESWGMRPSAMIGHSVGEYVAACLAGVFSLEDGLALVAARGRLMQEMPPGAMLSVPLSEAEVVRELDGDLALAAVNGPALCVVAGPGEAVGALERRLAGRGVAATRLHTSHAFHSPMMDPVRKGFLAELARVELRPPRLRFVSNLTGTWIRDEEATCPEYWADHLRATVRFADGAAELLSEPRRLYIEAGPGNTLATFLRASAGSAAVDVHGSLRHPKEPVDDLELILTNLGKLWLAGAPVDGEGLYRGQRRRRVPLPGYAFDRRRYWVEPGERTTSLAGAVMGAAEDDPEDRRIEDPERWFYAPVWRPEEAPPPAALHEPAEWLLLTHPHGLGEALAQSLTALGQRVTRVEPGGGFRRLDDDRFAVDPSEPEDYRRVLAELGGAERKPRHVVHLWTFDPGVDRGADPAAAARCEELGLLALVALARALGELGSPLDLSVVADRLFNVSGGEPVVPERALLEGACRVIPQEMPNVKCRLIDAGAAAGALDALAGHVLAELVAGEPGDEPVVALRGANRWRRTFERRPPGAGGWGAAPLRRHGVYLITGGLGGIGLAAAEVLAREAQARLVLLGRSAFPAREEWGEWLESRGGDAVSEKVRRLQALEEAGAEVLVLQADVCDRERMREVIDETRRRFGAVNGIFHAAGVPGGGLLRHKSADEVRRVLAPKVEGTRVLASLLEGEEGLDLLVLASSLASVLGGIGQVDYVAANAFLDAFAQDRAGRGPARVVSVDWDTWSESGMAVAAAGGQDLRSLSRPVEHPLLERCLVEGDDQQVYSTRFGAGSHWVLDEHRIEGLSLLPGTAYLEVAAAAFADAAGTTGIEIGDVAFLNPFFAPEEGQREVRTFLARDGERWRFSVASSEGPDPAGQERWTEYARGTVRRLAAGAPAARDLDEVRDRCGEGEETIDLEKVRHGAHWRCLRGVLRGESEMLASLRLPEELAGETADYLLHPSLMDAATSFFAGGGAVLYLPVGYERLRLHRPLPADLYSHVRLRSGEPGAERLIYDIELLGGDGAVLVEVGGYALQRVEDTAMRLEEGRQAQQQTRRAPATADAAAPAALADGLSDEEGRAAILRILGGATGPQVLVSTLPLGPRIARYRSTSLEQLLASQQIRVPMERHPRPELSTPFLAPRDERERAVAAVWQELLGIEEVGVHDDFFELGGHSLLGIQVNSRLRELYGVELSPGVIFERPTVAQLAGAVAEEAEGGTSMLVEIEAQRAGAEADLGVRVDELSDSEVDSMLSELVEDLEIDHVLAREEDGR